MQQQNLAFKHATLPKFLKENISCSFNYFAQYTFWHISCQIYFKRIVIPTTGGSADLGAEVIQQQNLAFKHATLPKFLKEHILCSFNYFG